MAELQRQSADVEPGYDLFKQYRSRNLIVAFDKVDGARVSAACTNLIEMNYGTRGTHIHDAKCSWFLGKRHVFVFIQLHWLAGWGNGRITKYRVEADGQRLVEEESFKYVISESGALVSEPRNSMFSTLVADSDDRLFERLVRNPAPEPPAPAAAPSPAAAPPPAKTEKSVEERLEALEDLRKKGLLTEDEYQEQRKKIVDSL